MIDIRDNRFMAAESAIEDHAFDTLAEALASVRGRVGLATMAISLALSLLIAAAVVIPLAVLAGLFVWLKLTEEADEEALELEQEATV